MTAWFSEELDSPLRLRLVARQPTAELRRKALKAGRRMRGFGRMTVEDWDLLRREGDEALRAAAPSPP